MISTDELARRIGTLRRQKGLTQSAMSEMLGVTVQAVSKWETGRALPELSRIDELADVLGVEVNYLLRGNDWEPNKAVEQNDKIERKNI